MEFNNHLDVAMEWLHKQGAFLTVNHGGKTNTMTISWGSVGFMWKKPIFMTLVRPQRYTNEFISQSEDFTISIPYGGELKKALAICGTKSGRDIDKEKEANISFVSAKGVISPVVDNCNMYYECKILYKHELETAELPEEIRNACYPQSDKHILYYGEIVECYEK